MRPPPGFKVHARLMYDVHAFLALSRMTSQSFVISAMRSQENSERLCDGGEVNIARQREKEFIPLFQPFRNARKQG